MSKTLDDLYEKHQLESESVSVDWEKLRQAILQWVADEVVGEYRHETYTNPMTPSERQELFGEHSLQDKQRQILKDHGWKVKS